MATRWVLENMAVQCASCNMFSSKGDGLQDELAKYIDVRHGKGTAQRLRDVGEQEANFTLDELNTLYLAVQGILKQNDW